jgi:hypothetical protein
VSYENGKCENKSCGSTMRVRTADVKRGWGRFCSKSCKAQAQSRRQGRRPRGLAPDEFYAVNVSNQE